MKRSFPFKRAEFADVTFRTKEGSREESASKLAFPHHMAEGSRRVPHSASLIKQYEPSNDERERVCNEVVSGLGSTEERQVGRGEGVGGSFWPFIKAAASRHHSNILKKICYQGGKHMSRLRGP